MSQKITSKNLQYTSTLPPFLARLRGEAAAVAGGGEGDGPDPMLAARRRHAKPRSASAEAEDAPLVVDERGNTVDTVRVGADGSVTQTGTEERASADRRARDGDGEGGASPGGGGDKAGEDDDADGKGPSGEKIAGVGGARKRKMGRVVGAGAEEEEAGARDERDRKTGGPATDGEDRGREDPTAAGKSKVKKKAKKIKLSFGDDEG